MATVETYSGDVQNPNEELGTLQFKNFIKAAINFKDSSEWKGDKRFFITFLPNSSSVQEADQDGVFKHIIRTNITGSVPDISDNAYTTGSAILSRNLAELSTIEIKRAFSNRLLLDDRYRGNQNYGAVYQGNGSDSGFHLFAPTPPIFSSGSYAISRMTDENPSLLVELNKDQQIPDVGSTGDKEFVVIPENLHPFIKDNLEYFLIQAGLDISGNATSQLKIDPTNRELK